jgi:hypothetical protein
VSFQGENSKYREDCCQKAADIFVYPAQTRALPHKIWYFFGAEYGHIGWCFPYSSLFSRIFPLPEKSALRQNVRYGIIKRLL